MVANSPYAFAKLDMQRYCAYQKFLLSITVYIIFCIMCVLLVDGHVQFMDECICFCFTVILYRRHCDVQGKFPTGTIKSLSYSIVRVALLWKPISAILMKKRDFSL